MAAPTRLRGPSVTERGLGAPDLRRATTTVRTTALQTSPADASVRPIETATEAEPTRPNSADCADSAGEWSPAIPLRQRATPDLPIDAFPPDWAEFIVALAAHTQTPPDLAACISLAVVATACARRVEVEVRPCWREPINLYVAVVLPPANLKSPVFAECAAPLFEHERNEAERLSLEIKKSAAYRMVAEKTLDKAQKLAASANPEQRAQKLADVDRLVAELEALPVVVAPRLVADDITPEKVAALMAEHGERIALLSAEGGVFGIMAGRYQPNSSPNLDVFLKGHSGDRLTVDRIGRGPVCIERPALTIGLAVQPDVIRRLADTPEFRGRGLLARFLYALPDSLVGSRDLAGAPSIPAGVRAAYRGHVNRLLALKPEGQDAAAQRLLRLSKGAQGRLEDFLRWVEPQLGKAGTLGSLGDWGGKLAGAVVRIAGLFQLWQEPNATEVDEATLSAAISLAEYFIPHAEAAFFEMGSDGVAVDAEVLIAHLRKDGRKVWTKRDLFSVKRTRFSWTRN